ncbi:hypothetical protein FAI40_00880 [Acetobacteraceae bacterium]|nr:hypothetical protein FAI40_00880 [Acetobacteraceae bacterium]
MLNLQTFSAKGGNGNVLYKALTHPLAAKALFELEAFFQGKEFYLFDPHGYFEDLKALYPTFSPSKIFTQEVDQIGKEDGQGGKLHSLLEMKHFPKKPLLVLSFDGEKVKDRLGNFLKEWEFYDLGKARLPREFTRAGRSYLDKCNFVTNFAFFRENEAFHTRLTTANYWTGYGGQKIAYWCRLFDEKGQVLQDWIETPKGKDAGVIIDSREIKTRFNLPDFTGQIFIHVQGGAGHDVLKYALDVWGKGENPSLSVTHDANSWPSRYFSSLPAPEKDEKLIVWIQNSHAMPIPKDGIGFCPMGHREEMRCLPHEIAPYATKALDVGALFPEMKWPAQFEMMGGNYVVRPRYEIVKGEKTRIAHLNVERSDLIPAEEIGTPLKEVGRGFILPFPILNPDEYETWLQPNPMSEKVKTLPLSVALYNENGKENSVHFLGNLPRDFKEAFPLHEWAKEAGHGNLFYDLKEGGAPDGWLHATIRFKHKKTGHMAETSFGGHIYNTQMVWRNEPQSYAGSAPGLSTRIFLKIGYETEKESLKSFCWLIYPCSKTSSAENFPSETKLILINEAGKEIAKKEIHLQPNGSFLIKPHEIFGEKLKEAGEGGYVLIRDKTVRLFGYHGIMGLGDRFSLDHMFGF